MTLTTEDGKPCEGIDQGPFEPIAVIGLGALMPDAHDIDAFWQNILDAKVSIRTLPEGRWPGPVDHFWKEGGPGAHTEGYSYAKIGAVVSDAEFDWRRWRQPPGTLPQIDPCQLWAVTVSADAIEHAGYDVRPATSTEPEPVLSLPMRLAGKTETCPIFVCGRITPVPWPRRTASPTIR